jgi:hypothetical protein
MEGRRKYNQRVRANTKVIQLIISFSFSNTSPQVKNRTSCVAGTETDRIKETVNNRDFSLFEARGGRTYPSFVSSRISRIINIYGPRGAFNIRALFAELTQL